MLLIHVIAIYILFNLAIGKAPDNFVCRDKLHGVLSSKVENLCLCI